MESAQPMADFTGTWTLTANLKGTPDPVPVTIEGTADGTFIMTLPDRTP